jgi:hypothetical protein
MRYVYDEPTREPPHVTIASLVLNEAEWLGKALECWGALADRICVLDNGSTDGTRDILNEAGVDWLIEKEPMWGNEWPARKRLWDFASEGADWVVHIDGDQCFAGDFRPHLRGNLVRFTVFDLWSPDEFRLDDWWTPSPWWKAGRVKRYQGRKWTWNERGLHVGHMPIDDVFGKPHDLPAEVGILHYAYVTPERREAKLDAYMGRRDQLTPAETYHARTILAPEPNTEPLPFTPTWRLL